MDVMLDSMAVAPEPEAASAAAEDPLRAELADDWGIDESSPAPAVFEGDETAIPAPAFFPTMRRHRETVAIGPVRLRPMVIAIAVSLFLHANIAWAVLWAIHRIHSFVPARPQMVRGDGAVTLGAIDHDGNSLDPGADGSGALKIGWAAPTPPAGAVPMPDDADEAPPPPTAPAPAVEIDVSDEEPAPPLVAADVSVNPLQPDLLPAFSRPLPVPSAEAADFTAALSPPLATTQPSLPDNVASAAPTSAQDNVSTAGDAHQTAILAGSSAYAPTDSGSLLNRPGAGGSNGKGGATTGDGGAAVTGRPGSPAGVIGPPLAPVYPQRSRELGETGRVVLEVDVLADGRIASIRVLSDAGHSRLAEAALDAFKGRMFQPALEDGKPVHSTLKYPIVFELHQRR